MLHRHSVFSYWLIGASLMLCAPAHAVDDATAACNAAMNAYGAAAASGDPDKMAAVFAPDGEQVSPWGFVAGHDALVKAYAPSMKPGDKEVDTLTSARVIGDMALCTGGWTFTPVAGASAMNGAWTKVIGKVGGEWKILNLTYNVAAPQ